MLVELLQYFPFLLEDINNFALAEDTDLWVFGDWHIDLDTDSHGFLSEHIQVLLYGRPLKLTAVGSCGQLETVR